MNVPDYSTLLSPDASTLEVMKAMGFPPEARPAPNELVARAEELAQEVMLTFKAGAERELLLQKLENICSTAQLGTQEAPKTSALPPAVAAGTDAAITETATRNCSSEVSGPSAWSKLPLVRTSAMALAAVVVLVVVANVAGRFNPRPGLQQPIEPAPQRPTEPAHLKSNVGKLDERVKEGRDVLVAQALNVASDAHRVWKEQNIPENANYWIWHHISEGNYEKSRYNVSNGYNSFVGCLRNVNPLITLGTTHYRFDRRTGEVQTRSAGFPDATGTKDLVATLEVGQDVEQGWGESETLLSAIIKTDPKTNPFRVQMAQDLLDRANAEGVKGKLVNMQVGAAAHTALMSAAYRDDEELVELLLKNGADPDIKAATGVTAASFATRSSIVRKLGAH